MHTLYEVETQIPTFLYITEASVYNPRAMKKFWGTTDNAVRIQIYQAICTYCLVAIIQKIMQLDRSPYEVLQRLSISLNDKTHLRDLFERTKFQNDKDRFRLNEPNLFDF